MQVLSLPSIRNLVIGYTVSVILGWFVVDWIMAVLRSHSEVLKKDKDSRKRDIYLVRILGALERFLFTTFIVFGQPAGIFAWLAIKVLTRWTSEKEKEGWETITRSNIYLIGNLLTVIFGVTGGLLCTLLPK